ncbi:MGA_1079 family surface serine endopeptidase, partial [Ureaplasma diversum]|uniref:MGA_1079 family surface serine endopeptidase n=1 Tax=Ureaplasma diversum TaxID=42094 RepID=UPI00056E5D0A
MNVASLNNQTAKIMLLDLDTDYLDFEVNNVKLNQTYDQSIVTYKITHKYNPALVLYKEVRFSLDNEKILKKINELKQTSSLDQYFEVDYYLLSKLNENEFNNQFDLSKSNKVVGIVLYADYNKPTIRRKQKYVNESFEYRIKQTPTIKDNKLVATVEFLFNNNVIFSKELITDKNVVFQSLEATEKDDDLIDLNQAKEILADNENLLTHLYLKKGLNQSHQDFYPDDAINVLNTMYDLPKFGKYTIAPRQLIKAYDSGNEFGGVAEIFWGILKTEIDENNQVVQKWVDNAFSDSFSVNHFKRYQYHDFIKPINNQYLTEDDFKAQNEFDPNLKKEIDLLDNSDVDFRRVVGRAESSSKTTLYRNLNIDEFLNQKAHMKANYFLRIIDPKDKEVVIGTQLTNKLYQPGEYVSSRSGHIPRDDIDRWSSANNKLIKEKTFYYFYDIKKLGHNSISFRLGFVKNDDKKQRYSPNKEFVINNVVNDYEQNLYPEVMLNNLIHYNIKVDYEQIATKTVADWSTDLKELDKHITLVNSEANNDLYINDYSITYKNFSLLKSYFRIGEIKQYGKNKAFVRFEVLTFDRKWVLGKNWYLISNFKNSENSLVEQLHYDNQKLTTLYYDNKNVKRIRELEPYIDDAEWSLKSDYEAVWKMDSKYIKHTLLSNNAFDRELDLEMYAGMLVFDSQVAERITSKNRTIKLKLDFEQL